MKLPHKLNPEDVTAIIDTREIHILDLSPLDAVAGTLTTGDYSIVGLEHVVTVERKSEADMLQSLSSSRDRFERELKRMLGYPVRALVVESSWARMESGEWRSKITPQSVIGSLMGIQAMGIPVMMCDNHERAGRYVSRLLYVTARRRYRELRSLVASTEELA